MSPFKSIGLIAVALLVSACGILPEKQAITLYNPQLNVKPDPSWSHTNAQISVRRPTALGLIDSPRILVRPNANEIQVYAGAAWVDSAPELVQSAVVQLLEDSEATRTTVRRGSGIPGEYELLMDLRHFEADYSGGATPVAVVEISAKLVRAEASGVIENRVFRATAPASGTDVAQVVSAFDTALSKASADIAGWTLQNAR
ncbi:ABC-type transport auxiliary lipoprotein family protein [Lysobacter soyae]|uniref:ABC-type transport auxiliary lipoprotein family protein n=1 Tax=Lysobacter soyae TaxID=2764185 RepID=A0ABX8WQ40_9GAMM|nr:ABC-type transport auxiliary lipoprotein family protein [Lysobacter sp. CJ11]QYR52718.1 ABC-type transport auxiliary lipoprotein family protein [Lysobacter sp. CJ11]